MNKEDAYDQLVFPLMAEIIRVCKAHGIAMFATFEIPTDESPDLVVDTCLPDGNGVFPDRIKAIQDTGTPTFVAMTITTRRTP